MDQKDKNKLEVMFTDEKKDLSYSGSLGALIGNTMTLLQMLYRSIRNQKNRHFFRDEVVKFVKSGVVFMSNEDIDKTLKTLKSNGGKDE